MNHEIRHSAMINMAGCFFISNCLIISNSKLIKRYPLEKTEHKKIKAPRVQNNNKLNYGSFQGGWTITSTLLWVDS